MRAGKHLQASRGSICASSPPKSIARIPLPIVGRFNGLALPSPGGGGSTRAQRVSGWGESFAPSLTPPRLAPSVLATLPSRGGCSSLRLARRAQRYPRYAIGLDVASLIRATLATVS